MIVSKIYSIGIFLIFNNDDDDDHANAVDDDGWMMMKYCYNFSLIYYIILFMSNPIDTQGPVRKIQDHFYLFLIAFSMPYGFV